MKKKGSPFIILLIAVLIVAAISLLPLNRLSGGKLKDFSLISDIIRSDSVEITDANTYIDPDLEAVLADIGADSISTAGHPDTSAEENKEFAGQEFVGDDIHNLIDTGKIEDYTPDRRGLRHLRDAIRSASGKPARIAVLGDSYIEGDILTEVVRERLQEKYGGKGAGYIPASSNITGFRNSVRQSCSNWKEHDFRKKGQNNTTLSGFSFSPDGYAKTVIKGSKKPTHTSSWSKSRVIYISPDSTSFRFYSAAGDNQDIAAAGSDRVQCHTLSGETEEVTFECSDPKMNVLGIFLDGTEGVAVDNMSIRGYAGIRHNTLNMDIAGQLAPYIDYDLIILEYGINALSAEQKNYNSYTHVLGKSIDRIRQTYPKADILLMGIGDRGIKQGAEVISMPVVRNMIDAQRKLAKEKGLLFFDTCAAMGGQGAVVQWAKNRDINKDYIHLSKKGGTRLGNIVSDAIETLLDE